MSSLALLVLDGRKMLENFGAQLFLFEVFTLHHRSVNCRCKILH